MATFKDAILRTTSMFGVMAVGLSAAPAAHAAIVNSVTNIQATPVGSACRISWTENVTGEIPGDGGGSDFYSRRLSDQLGNQIPIIPAFGELIGSGATATFSRFIDATIPLGSFRYDKYILHRDITVTPAEPILSLVQIPDSTLKTAGGACLNLRTNNEPTVDAGANQNASQLSAVALSGSASDLEGDPLSIQWTQTGGAAVTLSGANTLSASFVAPAKTNAIQLLTFTLAANDGFDTSTDTMTVSIPANVGPTANAGPNQNAQANSTVTLDGSASSDGDGDPITYQWTQTGGPPVTLSNATSANPTFTAPPVAAAAQALTFELVVNDGISSSAPDSVTINLPANTAPVANPGPTQNAGQGQTVQLDGTGSSDVDGQPLTYQWVQTGGPAVTLQNATTATPSFVVPAIPVPTAIIFELVVNDGIVSSAPAQLVIAAFPNNPPTVNAGPDATVAPGSTVVLSGGATDIESDPLTYQWTQTAGPAVTLTGATTLTPSFTAPPKTAAAQVLTFSLVANDGTSNSTADTVSITIPGNVAPTADAGSDQSVAGGASVILNGSASVDGDNDGLTFSWTQTAGPSVTLSGATTSAPGFTAPPVAAAAQDLIFVLTISDGIDTDTDTVIVTVAANVAPVANAGADQSVGQGQTVTLDGTSSTDADNQTLTYQWTQVSGPSIALTGASTATPSFIVPTVTSPTPIVLELVVNDGIANSTADQITITALPNAAPTVNAGPDATAVAGTNVTLAGTASDIENDPLTYQWTQTAGPAVNLSGATTLTPSFTAPPKTAAAQVLTFSFVANDGTSNSTADTVNITIPGNVGPTANAGADASVGGGTTATLNGSASTDGDGDALTYAWVQTGGPAVTLNGANTANPTFIAPAAATVAQTLTFELTVSDGIATSSPDTVVITIPDNAAPTVNAGPDATAAAGSNVTLAGTASDIENDPLTYQWTQTAGPAVTLTGATTLTPSFTAPQKTAAAQVLTFSLVANDGTSNSTADTVDITIPANVGPTASAGNDVTFPGGSLVTLEGFGTDADGDPLTLQWTQVAGPSVTLNGANTANPSFTAPPKTGAAQLLTFSLVASDGIVTSPADTVDVTISANVGPLANAGADASVRGGATVTLDGSGSTDGDGDALTYAWRQASGPSVTLSDPAAASPTFTAPASVATAQTISFDLVVSDGLQNSTADSVTITVTANSPPTANAGPDLGPIDSGSVVTLNGSGSNDPDGDPLTFAWTQVSGPAVTLSDATAASPRFTAPDVQGSQDLVFSLVVRDGQATSAPDTVTVAVRGVGTVTIVQRVIGSDASFAFTSNITALNGSITTSGGEGQASATGVSAGAHSIAAADLSAAGYALTDISCNDADSVVNLATRSVNLALSPSENLVCTFSSTNSREAAQTAITDFLTGRNALIMSMQPDLQHRMDRLNGGSGARGGGITAYGAPIPGGSAMPFSMMLGQGEGRLSTSLASVRSTLIDGENEPKPFDIWIDAQFANARLGSQEGSFRVVHAGADYVFGKDVLVGVLAQFDDFRDKGALAAGEAEGRGWMAGPYVMARLGPGLFGEARAAWGYSNNRVSPLGTYIDKFDTNRSFYSGSMIGQFNLGPSLEIRPEFTVRHMAERTESYMDSLNISIPDQTVSQGDISFRPRVQQVFALPDGWSLRPFASVEGIYTFGTEQNGVLGNGLRTRLEGGFDLFKEGDFRSSLSAFHDGVGSDGLRSTGVFVSMSFGY